MIHARWLPLLAAVIVFGSTTPAPACAVPVFRYAAERWLPDMYDVVVFHRGPLAPAQRQLIDRLEKAGFPSGGHSPIEVTTADLAGDLDPDMKTLWESQKGAAAPWLVLRTPRSAKKPEAVWGAGLNSAAVDTLLYSPVRHELAEAIRGGDSAIWVLLESGNKEKDDAAARMLRAHLRKLEKELKLPDLKVERPEDRIESGPNTPGLRIGFSLIRLLRSDPDEQPLVQMLLRVEDDLHKYSDDPIAFPVFGRGRALYALVGKGINEDTVGDACGFLIGPCGCEVKRLNPGSDLLISADWDGAFRAGVPLESKDPRERPVIRPTVKPAPDPVVTPTTKPVATPATNPAKPQPTQGDGIPQIGPADPDVPAPEPAADTSLFGLSVILLAGLLGTVVVAVTLGKWLRV